jgi:cytochrome oxidase assembly protein ShyY1
VRYRTNGDTNGYEVVTPLRTAAGTVLVDRGLVPVDKGNQIPSTAPPPPAGEVRVVGHVRRDELGRHSAITPVNGQVRLINAGAIGATLPYPVVDGYLGLLTVDPAQAGGFQPIVLPEISDGPHFWYAVQWFMFTGIGLAGIVVFIRGDLRERRTEREKAERERAGRDPAAAGAAPTPELSVPGS